MLPVEPAGGLIAAIAVQRQPLAAPLLGRLYVSKLVTEQLSETFTPWKCGYQLRGVLSHHHIATTGTTARDFTSEVKSIEIGASQKRTFSAATSSCSPMPCRRACGMTARLLM